MSTHRRDRAIANEAQLITHVRSSATLRDRVRFVAMETLPLAKQAGLVATSTSLAGVHGAGLTWVIFLPTRDAATAPAANDAAPAAAATATATAAAAAAAAVVPPPRCALLEILPRRMGRQGTHATFDYMRLAEMNGVALYRLKQPDTKACYEQDFRTCGNVTVSVADVADKLALVAKATRPAGAAV
tara:strand:- start:163 stop:723 length:561 start_codon:yes stop_codon:yes gene_type:complete